MHRESQIRVEIPHFVSGFSRRVACDNGSRAPVPLALRFWSSRAPADTGPPGTKTKRVMLLPEFEEFFPWVPGSADGTPVTVPRIQHYCTVVGRGSLFIV